MSSAKSIEAWHFIRDDRMEQYANPQKIAAGYVYEVDPPLKLCHWGLHASIRAIDALRYAPGSQVCRVRLSGELVRGEDKLCATRREVLWIVDAEDELRSFARWCALQVIDNWDAPKIVREYLETGDESKRSAAWDAARSAARSAAWGAAGAAAWDAARSAARSAARDAARDAAWDAARDAAWGAAWDAARSAAWGAARDAAWDAARDAAWGAAWGAAWDAQNVELERRLFALGGSDE